MVIAGTQLSVQLQVTPDRITEGGEVVLRAQPSFDVRLFHFDWQVDAGSLRDASGDLAGLALTDGGPEVRWNTTGLAPSSYRAWVTITPIEKLPALSPTEKPKLKPLFTKLVEEYAALPPEETPITAEAIITVLIRPVASGDVLPVTMRRAETVETFDQALWTVIRKSHQALSFANYKTFVEDTLQCLSNPLPTLDTLPSSSVPFPFVDAYKRLKAATEVFLMANCGVAISPTAIPTLTPSDLGEEDLRLGRAVGQGDILKAWQNYLSPVNGKFLTIPYLALIVQNRLGDVPLTDGNARDCYHILTEKLTHPCLLELIWSYWHEEGMLVQTLNTISLRFQNRRLSGRDPLAHLDLDPLRPLNNLLWGYIQDEQHRLTLARRTYEYDHHYGLPLYGKAVPKGRSVDSRSKFLENFHNLLFICQTFFNQDDDTTLVADGFPVLNALKDVHILLAEGAHNQFGDLPSTARMEMLMQQWLLARPEMQEFLSSRVMVPYTEPWMDRVDTMKKLQGWTNVSIMNFHRLADFGEQLLLSIRYGSWNQVDYPEMAANWARYWRTEVQGYVHAYRTVTGVDLTAEVADSQQRALRYLPPSRLLAQRLAAQAGKQ